MAEWIVSTDKHDSQYLPRGFDDSTHAIICVQ